MSGEKELSPKVNITNIKILNFRAFCRIFILLIGTRLNVFYTYAKSVYSKAVQEQIYS